MTVSELIDRLWALRGDLPVTVGTPTGDYPRVVSVSVRPADEGEAVYIVVE